VATNIELYIDLFHDTIHELMKYETWRFYREISCYKLS